MRWIGKVAWYIVGMMLIMCTCALLDVAKGMPSWRYVMAGVCMGLLGTAVDGARRV